MAWTLTSNKTAAVARVAAAVQLASVSSRGTLRSAVELGTAGSSSNMQTNTSVAASLKVSNVPAPAMHQPQGGTVKPGHAAESHSPPKGKHEAAAVASIGGVSSTKSMTQRAPAAAELTDGSLEPGTPDTAAAKAATGLMQRPLGAVIAPDKPTGSTATAQHASNSEPSPASIPAASASSLADAAAATHASAPAAKMQTRSQPVKVANAITPTGAVSAAAISEAGAEAGATAVCTTHASHAPAELSAAAKQGHQTAGPPCSTGSPCAGAIPQAATLHDAAAAGNMDQLETLLASGSDANARNADGSSALHKAAAAGQLAMVRRLISIPSMCANALDIEGRTALFLAIYHQHLRVASLLNDHDRSSRFFKLHWGAQHGYLQAVQEVLHMGAPPDLEDEHRMTPLHRACKHGHLAVVSELLHTRKVDIDAVSGHGWTPALYAAAAGAADILKLLLQHARDKKLQHTFMSQRVKKKGDADDGLDVLLLAAKHGHDEVAEVALDNGANLDTNDSEGRNPLHVACTGSTYRHLATVELLVGRGARHDELNNSTYTPLLLAANHQEFCTDPTSCSHQDMVQLMMKHGASMHLGLLLAAKQGNMEKVQQFLQCQCEACKQTPVVGLSACRGWTALMVASGWGHAAVVEALVAAGSDVEAALTSSSASVAVKTALTNGSTSLMLAATFTQPSTVKALLTAGARVHKMDEDSSTALHRACSKAPVPADDRQARSNQIEVLQLLLAAAALYRDKPVTIDEPVCGPSATLTTTVAGPSVTTTGKAAAAAKKIKIYDTDIINGQNSEGSTPLMAAAVAGNMDLVEILLQHPRVDVTTPDKKGAVAIHKAAKAGHLSMVKELIAAGSPILPTDADGSTPLHEAAAGGHLHVVEYLLTAQDANDDAVAAVVNISNATSWTPLHFAAKGGHLEVLQYLMSKGADPMKVTSSGGEALNLACISTNLPVVDLLLGEYKKRKALFRINITGWSPVTIACTDKRNPKLLQKLLEYMEAEWDPEDVYRLINHARPGNGYAALHEAVVEGHTGAVELLLEPGKRRADVLKECKTPALHLAALEGHTELVRMLLERGAPVDATEEDGCMAISHAVFNNMVAPAEMLLQAAHSKFGTAEPLLKSMDKPTGFSPIHYAAMRGNIESVELLSKHGQDLEQLTRSGRTPLHIAAAYGHNELVEHMLQQHCSMDTMLKPAKAVKSKWRFDGPCRITHKQARVVLTTGELVKLSCPLPATRGINYFEVSIGSCKCNPTSKLPMEWALGFGVGLDKFQAPPAPGRNPNTYGYWGASGFLQNGVDDEAKRYGPKYGPSDTIGVVFNRAFRSISFTRNGAHLGVAVTGKDLSADIQLEDMAALACAVGISELDINLGLDAAMPFVCSMDDVMCEEEELLSGRGREPWRFKERVHPIHMAAYNKCAPVLESLIAAGASTSQEDADGWTPLHFAALAGWEEGILLLLEYKKEQLMKANRSGPAAADPADRTTGAEAAAQACFVNAKTKADSSPLRFAVKNSHIAAARALITSGNADCMVTDGQKRTLLMLAASTGQVELMDLLIKKGVAVKAKDAAGRTAMQYACNAAAAEYLEKQTNETIPYPGHDWLELRVDSEVKQGAVGSVVMGKLRDNGEKVAIKYHNRVENRDDSYAMLTSCFGDSREARQYIACVPTGLTEQQAKFDDLDKFPGHPYALVLEGGDQTLQEILDELGPVDSRSSEPALQLPDNQTRFIFGCLVSALSLVHSKGYTHHDLKAANFVRFYDGKFKLIDFDNAKLTDQRPAGHTTPEICPPEYAKYYINSKIALQSKRSGAAPALKPPQSSLAMDMWSLGCVLYQLVTRRRLVADLAGWSEEEFNMRSADDAMKVWYDVKDAEIARVLDAQLTDTPVQQAAHELLLDLLREKPAQRWNISQVTNSAFLGRGGASLRTIQDTMQRLDVKMDIVVAMVADVRERMVKLSDLPAQLQAGLTKISSEIYSFRGMVLQVHKAVCPSTFIIGPDIRPAESIKGITSGKLASWADGLLQVFSRKMSMTDFAVLLSHDSYRLQLVCEACGEPQGEGYSVKKPKEWVPRMLPAMQLSLQVANICSFGLGLASIVFPGVPQIPEDALAKGNELLTGLSHKSSADDFACVQDALDGEEADGETFQRQVDDGLRQLCNFLSQVDPTQTWGGLALVDLDAAGSQHDGCEEAEVAAQDALPANGKGRAGAAATAKQPAMPSTVLWVCKSCLLGKCQQSGGGKGNQRLERAVAKQDSQMQQLEQRCKEIKNENSVLRKHIQSSGLMLPPSLDASHGNAVGASSGRHWTASLRLSKQHTVSAVAAAGTPHHPQQQQAQLAVRPPGHRGGGLLGCFGASGTVHPL